MTTTPSLDLCFNCRTEIADPHRKKRESQAVFRCHRCAFQANADWTASVIIRNRAYYRLCQIRPRLQSNLKDAPPTGWSQQPSDGRRQLILPIPVKRAQSERRRDELLPAAGSVAPGRRTVSQRPSQTPQMLADYSVNTLYAKTPTEKADPSRHLPALLATASGRIPVT